MAGEYEVYVERGAKRAFAGALEWPGWCRSGRDEDAALAALVAYGERYERVVREAGLDFALPSEVGDLRVVERLPGNATTDFGAPAMAPSHDERPLEEREDDRLLGLLRACWAAFRGSRRSARGLTLRKGPRGGGRDLDKIVDHVIEAERSYLSTLGGRARAGDGDADARIEELLAVAGETLRLRARGDVPSWKRPGSTLWSPRYYARRSAWHVLDHAWEIEDRAEGVPSGGGGPR